MQDPHPYVQDTTAWTIGRIFEFMHSPDIEPPIVTPDTLPPIIACLTKSLMGSPHIAYRVCCAISSLAAGFQGSTGAGAVGCGAKGRGSRWCAVGQRRHKKSGQSWVLGSFV